MAESACYYLALEKSMTVVMVALPVVFQPELRRALEQIGRGRYFISITNLMKKNWKILREYV